MTMIYLRSNPNNQLLANLGVVLCFIGSISLLVRLLNPWNWIGGSFYLLSGSLLIFCFTQNRYKTYLSQIIHFCQEGSMMDLVFSSNSFYQIMGILLFSIFSIQTEMNGLSSKNASNHSLEHHSKDEFPASSTPTARRVSEDFNHITISTTSPPITVTSATLLGKCDCGLPLARFPLATSQPVTMTSDCFQRYFSALGRTSNAFPYPQDDCKAMVLTDLVLSCCQQYLLRQWSLYSDDLLNWLEREYRNQQEILLQWIQHYCQQQCMRWFPWIPTSLLINRIGQKGNDEVQGVLISQRSPRQVIHQYVIDFNRERSHQSIPTFQRLEKILYNLDPHSVGSHELSSQHFLLATILSNIVAYRLGVLPRNVQWLRILYLQHFINQFSDTKIK